MDFSTIAVGTTLISLYMLIPGMALSLAAFPRKKDVDLTERIGLSLFLGLAVMFIQYFNDKNLMIPINTSTTAMTMVLVTAAGLIIWQIRLRTAGNGVKA